MSLVEKKLIFRKWNSVLTTCFIKIKMCLLRMKDYETNLQDWKKYMEGKSMNSNHNYRWKVVTSMMLHLNITLNSKSSRKRVKIMCNSWILISIENWNLLKKEQNKPNGSRLKPEFEIDQPSGDAQYKLRS